MCPSDFYVASAVVLASVHKQLMASPNNTKVVGTKRINYNSEVDGTRVIGAEWVPQQNGQYFVLGHLSGKVYLYAKVSSCASLMYTLEPPLHRKQVPQSFRYTAV